MFLLLAKNDTEEIKKGWKLVRDGRKSIQRLKALDLIHRAKVDIPERGCGFREIQLFQNYYAPQGIAIVVYDQTTFGSGEPPLFNGRPIVEEAVGSVQGIINICHEPREKHFHTILNLIGASKTRFFCPYCNFKYSFVEQHVCAYNCKNCFSYPACDNENGVDTVHCEIL